MVIGRRALAGLATAGILVGAAACTGGGNSGDGGSGSVIKIGWVSPLSGADSYYGLDSLDGAKVAVSQINAAGGINGQKIKLVTKDDQGVATETATQLRSLAASGVDIAGGFIFTPSCTAADPVAKQYKMILLATACSDRFLTSTQYDPNRFDVAVNTAMMTNAAAAYAAAHPGVTTWDNLNLDYDTGHAYWSEFQSALATKTKGALKPGSSIFVPLNQTQWQTTVQSLVRTVGSSSSDGLFSFLLPGDWVSLVKQAQPYNLFSKYKSILAIGGDEQLFQSLGKAAPLMENVYDYYHGAYNNALNSQFVSGYQSLKKSKTVFPDAVAYQGYATILAAQAAIKAAHSTDPTKMIATLPGTKFQTPVGSVEFRKDHQLQAPVTIFSCQGDASSSAGYTCGASTTVEPSSAVMPPVQLP